MKTVVDFSTVDGILDLADVINYQVEKYMEANTVMVSPEQLALDRRSARFLLVSDDGDFIAVHNDSKRSLEYYGGFEYVSSESVITLGDYTIYLNSDERVEGHIDEYLDKVKRYLDVD